MAENWDEQFKRFLKRAGEDLKQMGQDIRGEAQKLIAQVQDPKKQELVREKAREIGTWARQTASDVADLVDKGAAKAEEAIANFRGEGAQGATSTPPPAEKPAPSAPETAESKKTRAPGGPAKKTTSKTMGAKKRPGAGAPKKKAAAAKTKKTIGRKRS